jgi:hypothetical protein
MSILIREFLLHTTGINLYKISKQHLSLDYLSHFIEFLVGLEKTAKTEKEQKEQLKFIQNLIKILINLIIGLNQKLSLILNSRVHFSSTKKKKKKNSKPCIKSEDLIFVGLANKVIEKSIEFIHNIKYNHESILVKIFENLSQDVFNNLLNVYPKLTRINIIILYQDIILCLINHRKEMNFCKFSNNILVSLKQQNYELSRNYIEKLNSIKNMTKSNTSHDFAFETLKEKLDMDLLFRLDWNIKNLEFLFLKEEKPNIQDLSDRFEIFELSFELFRKLDVKLDGILQVHKEHKTLDLFHEIDLSLEYNLQSYLYNLRIGCLVIECKIAFFLLSRT